MKSTLNNIKSNLGKASVNKRLYVFLVCLLLSTFYWMVNVLGNQYSSNIKVKVQYINQPGDGIILTELPSFLTVSVSTDGYRLLGYKLNLKSPSVQIDLSDFQIDESKQLQEIIFENFILTISKQLGGKMLINDVHPKRQKIIVDTKVVKQLKVLPSMKLTFKNQYQLAEATMIKPNLVDVTGPKSILDTITSIPTFFFELNNIENSTSYKTKLSTEFLSKNHLLTSNVEVEVIINTNKFTEYKLNLPIYVENGTDTLIIETIPEKVELKFLIPLAKISQLNSDDFVAMVDCNELSHVYKKLKVHLSKRPDYIRDLSIKPAKVEYVLKRK